MPLNKLSSSTKVDDEHRKLAKQQQELKKLEARLQKKLSRIPVEEQKRKKLQVAAAAPSVSLGPVRVPRSGAPSPRRGTTRLSRDMNAARIKFLVLCLILATILVMLWRAVPS